MQPFSLFGRRPTSTLTRGIMNYGGHKADGSHDHRANKGADRTPAQKRGDSKRSRSA